MRKSDVASHLRHLLVPLRDRPNVSAMIAPPTPRLLPPGSTVGVPSTQANQALGRLQGAMAQWPDSDLLTRTQLRREAVQSSMIEGTRTQLDELLTYEATRSDDGMPADVRVTERYVEALQCGLQAVRMHGRSALDLALVNRMHAILMQDEPIPKGEYRTLQAWIGGGTRIEDATFVPTPPEHIAACMHELESSMLQYAPREDEQGALSVIAQLAIAHAQFETIHPYADGNGRTGRILMPLILAAEGLPALYLSGTLMRHKTAYYAALRDVQLRGEWRPWLQLVYRAVIDAVDETLSLAADLTAIVAQWAVLTAGKRRDSAARRLPPRLLGRPVVTVAAVAELLDISVPAASKGINELVSLGVLSVKDGRKWGRTFHADAILLRLNRSPV